jgi:hypothetical protein
VDIYNRIVDIYNSICRYLQLLIRCQWGPGELIFSPGGARTNSVIACNQAAIVMHGDRPRMQLDQVFLTIRGRCKLAILYLGSIIYLVR